MKGEKMTFGGRLRAAREARGLTYARIEREYGVSKTAWQEHEAGVRRNGRPIGNPRPDTLVKMARALDLPLRTLYEWAGLDYHQPPDSDATEQRLRELEDAIRRAHAEIQEIRAGQVRRSEQ